MNLNLFSKEIIVNTYILTGKIDNIEIINNLINFVKNNDDDTLYNETNVKGKFTGFKSAVWNKDFHLFLKLIQPAIKSIYPYNFTIYDAWGNILKKEGEVTEHDHKGTTAFCGLIYLTENGPGTYFKEYDLTVEEEIGKFVLFHPQLKHSVKKIENNIERISFAFNCNIYNDWNGKDTKPKIKWVNKE